ncbi:hypothetical protein L0337_45715 [candidate division KSB1 bacterium]|nr:hypothetical protein [candidate division KSB1 bacterium]
MISTAAFAQTTVTNFEQSMAAGSGQSGAVTIVAVVGQAMPLGEGSSEQVILSGGFFYTLPPSSNQPPSITHTPSTPQLQGQPIVIRASISDDKTGVQATLNYRRGGVANFSQLPMMPIAGANNYETTIPSGDATSRGVDYYIVAIDMDGVQVRKPDAGGSFYSMQIQVTSEAKPTAQPGAGNGEQTAYRLISVPLQMDNNPSATTVLEKIFGPYDDTKWRLFGLDPNASQNLSEKEKVYTEFRSGGDLSPGKSLFLISRDGKTISIGAAKSVRTDPEFQIPLQKGHNLIATPFNFDTPKNKLRLQSGGTIDLQTYRGNWVVENNNLSPWEGYYLPVVNEDVLLVNPNFSSSAAPATAEKTVSGEWKIRILAQCGEAADTYNFAGVSAAGEGGWDGNDLVEAPPIGDYVSLYFPHAEWGKFFERYREDIRSIAEPNQRWRFAVETNIINKIVTLRFEGLQDMAGDHEIFLVDEAMQYKQNLRENGTYQYQPRRLESATDFTLIAGKADFVAAQTANAQGIPNDFVLEQNFPNPFWSAATSRFVADAAPRGAGNPETAIRFGLPKMSVVTIRIIDLNGREIATVLDRVELPAGLHQRIWNGRDDQGRAVASGIYFYQLQVGNFMTTKKLTLMR